MKITPKSFGGYDVEHAIAEVRAQMRRSDPVSLKTVEMAEDYARHMQAQFEDRDLRLVADTLLVSGASIGGFLATAHALVPIVGVAINVQCVAAVLILDQLEAAT